MILARNLAIVALIALAVTVVPGGGNVTTALLTALFLGFIAAIGLFVGRFWQQSSMTRDVMTDRNRLIFYGSLGALALMIVGLDELFATGPGTIVWLAVVAAAIFGIYTTWREANA
jgi:hypothetical protein